MLLTSRMSSPLKSMLLCTSYYFLQSLATAWLQSSCHGALGTLSGCCCSVNMQLVDFCLLAVQYLALGITCCAALSLDSQGWSSQTVHKPTKMGWWHFWCSLSFPSPPRRRQTCQKRMMSTELRYPSRFRCLQPIYFQIIQDSRLASTSCLSGLICWTAQAIKFRAVTTALNFSTLL